jgi:hypothetical protein
VPFYPSFFSFTPTEANDINCIFITRSVIESQFMKRKGAIKLLLFIAFLSLYRVIKLKNSMNFHKFLSHFLTTAVEAVYNFTQFLLRHWRNFMAFCFSRGKVSCFFFLFLRECVIVFLWKDFDQATNRCH